MLDIKSQKGNAVVAITIVLVLLVATGLYFISSNNKSDSTHEGNLNNNNTITDKSEDFNNVMVKGGENFEQKKTFNLNAFNFGYSENEIRVKKGDKVRIELTSTDGFHDLVIDEFDVATDKINTGEKTFVEFTVNKVGTFEYYCSVGKHRELGMVGNLIVEEDMAVMNNKDKIVKSTPALYQDYSEDSFKNAIDKKRVLFFYASWCPTCRSADKEISKNLNQIPDNVIVFKTNYDKEKELKLRYGISYQHTFVQVDSNGKELAKWNGGGAKELAAQIK